MVIGDTNFDLLKNDILSNLYKSTLAENGYFSLINKVTRHSLIHRESCLDHIFINTSKIEAYSNLTGILLEKITDHYPILLHFNCTGPSSFNNFTYQKFDMENFNDNLLLTNWNDVLCKSDSCQAYDEFENKVTDLIDKSTSIHKISYSSKLKPLNPWMTKGILLSVRQKNRMYNRLQKLKNTELFFISGEV